jgi:hypothetical protein
VVPDSRLYVLLLDFFLLKNGADFKKIGILMGHALTEIWECSK